MQKIRDGLVEKIYSLDINSKYLFRLIFELIQISNEKGEAEIYYKDIVEKVGCKTSTFYECLHDLDDMGFVRIKKAEYKGEIHVSICGNDFTDEKGYTDYLDINTVYFADSMYSKLSAGAMKLYLHLYFRTAKAGAITEIEQKSKETENKDKPRKERNKVRYKKTTSYALLARQIGLCPKNTTVKSVPDKAIRAVKKYIKELIANKLISFGTALKNDTGIYITVIKDYLSKPTHTVSNKGGVHNEVVQPLYHHWEHFVKNLCRRHRKMFDEQNLRDTALLINQYSKTASSSERDIYKMIANAVTEFKEYSLSSKSIHAILKKMLKKDYSNDILLFT